jgi:ABC-type transport system involved in cytochrome c biogenesis permease subunit
MYESVVWVSFGAMVFSLGIEYFYRWRFILFAGSIVSAGCLLLADNAPVVLDPSLQPLQAVLNSNFWLTSHVLTITISYAAFFLAFALGDIALFFYLKGADENNPKVKAITLGVYRAMQVGVAFLAPGIILGGIWADYSWGRFWGWDPKETWALIVLLGYIAILHGRIAGLIRSYGLVVSSIVAFSLVIMAWYGVNYILGAGLHSYGFGAGGVEYVAIFVGLHFLYVIFVSVVKKSRG